MIGIGLVYISLATMEARAKKESTPVVRMAAGAVPARTASSNTALVVDEPERTEEELERAARDRDAWYEQSDDRVLPPPARLFADPGDVRRHLERAALCLRELVDGEPPGAGAVLRVACRTARAYSGRIHELVEELRHAAERGVRTVCVMRATRLQ